MPFIPLTPNYHVSPQLTVEDVKAAKEAGYTHIICNRPDGEAAGQPGAEDIRAAAEAHGLSFEDLPISEGVSTNHMRRLREALKTDERILAYCRSGTRSALLWVAARIRAGEDVDETLRTAQLAGYDFTPFHQALSALGAQGKAGS